MEHIDRAQFEKRFVSMILAGQGFPKKPLDRHILLLSAASGLERGRVYAERELNDALRAWTARFGQPVSLDHVTLRRYLVDEHYITRDSGGQAYELAAAGLPITWDPELEAVDLDVLVAEAEEERERRKQEYLRKAKS